MSVVVLGTQPVPVKTVKPPSSRQVRRVAEAEMPPKSLKKNLIKTCKLAEPDYSIILSNCVGPVPQLSKDLWHQSKVGKQSYGLLRPDDGLLRKIN